MRISLAQIVPRLGVDNTKLHLEIIEKKIGQSDLVVFPELSLHGYWLQDKVYEIAATLETLTPLIEASRAIDVIVGLALKEEKTIYNTALYLSGGRVLHTHYKNHLPTYGMFEESRYFTKGKEALSFMTPHGRAMMLVCEDLWRPAMIATVAMQKPKLLYVIANSPARDFLDEELLIQSQWDAILKSTALLCGTTVVFVNRVGFEDGLGFWGGSTIISPQAQKIASMPVIEAAVKTFTIEPHRFEAKEMIFKHD